MTCGAQARRLARRRGRKTVLGNKERDSWGRQVDQSLYPTTPSRVFVKVLLRSNCGF